MSIDPRFETFGDDFNPTAFMQDRLTRRVWQYMPVDSFSIDDEYGKTPIHQAASYILHFNGGLLYCDEYSRAALISDLLSAVWPDWAAHWSACGWENAPYDKYPDLHIVRNLDQWLTKHQGRWVRYTC